MSCRVVHRVLATLLVLCACCASAVAQQPPAVAFDSLLHTYFDAENGLIAFTSYDLAFAPDEPFRGQVVVVNSSDTVIASFPFLETYKVKKGVFARAMLQGPADIQLTEPGIYNIVVLVDGKPISRLGVALVQTSAGDDPFDPQRKFRFDGLWRSHAYLTMRDIDGGRWPELNLWVGSIDLPEGKARDSFTATLLRNGEAVAHTKVDLGSLAAGHYDWQRIGLFHPHDRKSAPNARYFMEEDLLVDGSYEVRVVRGSDGQLLRSYDFSVKDGKPVPLPETQFGYQPAIDYVLPRTIDRGSSDFEFVEAFWIKGGSS